MCKPNLEELLRSYAEAPVPKMQGSFEDAVWQEIRRGRQMREPFFDWLSAFVWRVHFASASVAIAVALGVAFAWLGSTGHSGEPVFRALGLQVFSERPPTLPLTSSSWQP
jgi:anti-sigma-K factor RskA